ncbi:MAG: proton-conducting transporter membrane subunit [Desulfobacterales bacterium]|jgi:multicomponent Na+:H+ antiporter subunit A
MANPHGSHQNGGASKTGLVSAALPLLLFAGLCTVWPAVVRGEVFQVQWPWMPSIDLYLRFRLDGLSLLFCLIVTGAGFFVSLYAASYMAGHPQTGRFFFFLHAFMISMLGVVTADNLLLLFVFWEGTTVFSYLLIGFDHESESARDNARQAMLVTGAGGLALLLGIFLLKAAGGSFTISQWVDAGDQIRGHSLYPYIFLAVFLAAATKSAQFPFHFWLPNAMSAPTPISAFLHAATMVKAGIYLLMRFHPLLGGTPIWMGTLVVVGGVTALWGAVQALAPCDMKRVLAYTTIMALGVLTMFLGGRTTPALTAAATFLLVHALYKASLFLATGSIDHQAGTRQLDRLGGLWRAMPLTAIAVAAAAMSMAGFPLFFGFIGKEIMYKGALTEDMFPMFATAAALLSNSLMTAVAGIVFLGPFFGRRPDELGKVTEAPWTMRLGPAVMGILGIVFGIIPWWVAANLIEPAVRSFDPTTERITLSLYHGINTPLLLSIVTLTLGALVYRSRSIARRVTAAAADRLPVTTQRLYQGGLDLFLNGAAAATKALQNGSLHTYLSIIFLVTIAAIGWPWIGHVLDALRLPGGGGPIEAVFLVGLIALATVVVVTAKNRLAAIGGLGGVGGGVALTFLVFGAPDIALTQLMVETLTVIIVSLVLLRLPPLRESKTRSAGRRAVDAGLSLAAGMLIASLLMGVDQGPLDRSLTQFFENNSYVAAHGRNVVNVILVDFRSLDTLGEITVVVLAALAGVALIRRPGAGGKENDQIRSVILQTATRLMVGIILVFAAYLLLRGHHEPGGGFAGALVAGTAFALFGIAEGPVKVRRAVRLRPAVIAMAGLATAAVAGLAGLFSGAPFLTGIWWNITSHIAVGTPILFDIGVFMAVLGAILAVLLALEEN